MNEKIIEVVVTETDSKRDDFPEVESVEGKKMIQTVEKESDSLENNE